MKPDGENLTVTVKRIVDEDGADMESAPHPKQVLYIDPVSYTHLRRDSAEMKIKMQHI